MFVSVFTLYPNLHWSLEVSAVSAAIHNSVNYQPIFKGFFFFAFNNVQFFSLATPQHLSTQSGWGGGGGGGGGREGREGGGHSFFVPLDKFLPSGTSKEASNVLCPSLEVLL